MTRLDGLSCAQRRGAVTLELILVFPILIVLVLASLEFAMVSIVQATVTHAATVGAREAGKGVDVNELAEVVQAVVGMNCITVSNAVGSGTLIVLEDGAGTTAKYGDPTMTCETPNNPISYDAVRVTLWIELEATPICDMLRTFGFSLSGRCLHASSVVKKE